MRDEALVTVLYDTGLRVLNYTVGYNFVNDVVKRLADRAAVDPYTYERRGKPDNGAHTL